MLKVNTWTEEFTKTAIGLVFPYSSKTKSTHRNGKIISHVLPYAHFAEIRDLSAASWGRVPIDEPPGGVEHTDEPKPREEQEQEQNYAEGG